MRRAIVHTAAALLAFAGPMAAARLLLEAPGLSATLDQRPRCGEPASITVEAGQPDVFQGDSSELQRLVDAAHAMLRFECPELTEIQVSGVLKGLRDPVYRGIATAETNWVLQAQQTIQSEASRAAGAPSGTLADAPTGPGAPPSKAPSRAAETEGYEVYTVARLSAGMTVDEARSAVSDVFGVTPDYDARQGVLTMTDPVCPQGQQWGDEQGPPKPGWKCLRAWFTDEREAKLYLLELVQVVPNRGVEPVERFLTDHYGPPVQRRTGEPLRGSLGPAGGPAGEALYLAWGDAVDARAPQPPDAPRPTHPLEATVEPAGDAIVTTVTLYGPSVGPGGAVAPADALDLKL